MIIEWNDELSVGVPELDEQHKDLLRLIDEAYHAVEDMEVDRSLPFLVKMRTYAQAHFVLEERLMEEAGYPGLAAHRKSHARFVDKILALENDHSAPSRMTDVFFYLSKWLRTHILTEDMDYANMLDKKSSSSKE